MTRTQAMAWSGLAWLGVAAFWLVATRRYHPTTGLAVVVTASLMTAYASAAYVNHLLLVPWYARRGQYGRYAATLVAVMAVLNGLALAVIRVAYARSQGPDPDPNGVYVHYAIDFFGMLVHVLGAAVVVRAFSKGRSTAHES